MDMSTDLALISKKLLLREPFYGLFMIGLLKSFSDELETAGVKKNGLNVQLLISPKFWKSLSQDNRLAILKHEMMHVCFEHLTMRERFADKYVFNLAADMEINQYIRDLPEDAVTIDKYFDSNHRQHYFKGTKYYYDYLMNLKKQGNQSIMQAIDEMKDGSHISTHDTWKSFEDLDETEQKLIQSQVRHYAKEVIESAKSRGFVPNELSDWVYTLFKVEKPNVDWRKLVRRFIGGSKEVFTRKTRRKDSKRIKGSPAIKIKTKPFAIVYWDQSGSVSKREHEMLFSEVRHMYKAGINFDIAPFNTKVLEPYRYKGEMAYKNTGGGTSFTPLAEHFNSNQHKYSFAIILTDGEAETPPKFSKPVLWAITPQGINLNEARDFPGTKIKMTNES